MTTKLYCLTYLIIDSTIFYQVVVRTCTPPLPHCSDPDYWLASPPHDESELEPEAVRYYHLGTTHL